MHNERGAEHPKRFEDFRMVPRRPQQRAALPTQWELGIVPKRPHETGIP